MSENSKKSGGIDFTFKPRQFKVPLPPNKSRRDAQQQQKPTPSSSPNFDNRSSNASSPSASPRATISPSASPRATASPSASSRRSTMSPSTSSLFKQSLHSLSSRKKRDNFPTLSNQLVNKRQSFTTEQDNKSQQPHDNNNNTANKTEKSKAAANKSGVTDNNNKPKVIKELDEKLNTLKSFIAPNSNKQPINGSREHQSTLPNFKIGGKQPSTASFATPSSQLKRSVSQPNLSSSAAAARANKKTINPSKNTTTRESTLINSLSLSRMKSEPSLVTINDSEEDTIDAIATSYKKRLGNKERANTEAKAKIEELEEYIKQQKSRIHQLEDDEKLNMKVIEYNLANYSRDKKRIDALTEDLECFKCIFHSLKSMLDTSQRTKEDSEDDFFKLSQIVQDERSTQANFVEQCKKQFEKLSNYYEKDFREIFTALSLQKTRVHEHVMELKPFLLENLVKQQQQDQEAQKNSLDEFNNNLQVIRKEFKDASKDMDEFVSKFKKDKIYIDSVLSMCEANKLSSIGVYNISRELEADFMDMEIESEALQKELNALKLEKESLEQKVIELTRLNESIKSSMRSELFQEQQDEAYKMLDLQNLIMTLRNEQLGWQIEKRELTDQIKTLKEENDRAKATSTRNDSNNINIAPTKTVSDSLLYQNGNNRIPRVITVNDSSEDRDTSTEDDTPLVAGRRNSNFTRLSLSRTRASTSKRTVQAARKPTGFENSSRPPIQVPLEPCKTTKNRSDAPSSSDTKTTSKYWEDQEYTPNVNGGRKYNTRRNSTASRKRALPPTSDDENAEEITNDTNNDGSSTNQQNKKQRRKIRKLPGGGNDDLNDSDDADMSKKITKAIEVSLPEGAKDAHINKKKQ